MGSAIMRSLPRRGGFERAGRGVQVVLAVSMLISLSSVSSGFVSTAVRSRQLSAHAGGLSQGSTMRGTSPISPAMQTFALHRAAFAVCALFAAAATRATSLRSQQKASLGMAAVKMMAVDSKSFCVSIPARPAVPAALAQSTRSTPPIEQFMPEMLEDAATTPDLLDFSRASYPPQPSSYQECVAMSAVAGVFGAVPSTQASRTPSVARFAGGARCRASRTGASRGAERTARRAVGAKLQAAAPEQFHVQPAAYDPSCIRGKIQFGIRIESSLCSVCGRESRSSPMSAELGVLSTGERIQVKISYSESVTDSLRKTCAWSI